MTAKRTKDNAMDMFTLMHNLSVATSGRTVGEMQMSMNWLTRGQTQRILDTLETIGFAYHEIKKHGRTGKKVYHLTENCAIHLAAIAREYAERH